MSKKFAIPLRLKMLVIVLAFLMVVVGFITATMADLFHQDKTAYVRDLSASETSDIKTEIDTILNGYVSATRVLSEVLFAEYIEPDAKQQLIRPLFAAYPDVMGLVTVNAAGNPVSIYNAAATEFAGIDADELVNYAPTGANIGPDTLEVNGVTLNEGTRAITLTMGQAGADGIRPIVAIASPALVERAMQRADAFQTVLIGSNGDPVATSDNASGDIAWASGMLTRIENLEEGASRVDTIWDDGVEYFAGATGTSTGQLSVVTRISVSAAYLTARQLLNDLVVVGLIIVFIAAVGAVWVARRFTRPGSTVRPPASRAGSPCRGSTSWTPSSSACWRC